MCRSPPYRILQANMKKRFVKNFASWIRLIHFNNTKTLCSLL